MTDSETKRWIRGPADEMAVKAGCRFDPARGQFVVDWFAKYLRLYEGDAAGQPFTLLPWADDAVRRLFGWVKYSERWKREIRRFRQATIFCAKKNGKSPLLAGLALYLTCGDGEQGAKVFLAAKDGKQIRGIVSEHTRAMLEQSPELMSECSLNLATMRITHKPTRSWLEPLSSSNSRTIESKEGLNGSVLVDELHVTDRDLMRTISRAGISRSEPLQIEVSTAGANPDSYGHERFQYALEVEQGKREDQELFVCIHAAPQDLSAAQLDADPLKYGRMANPAMGALVDDAEFLADYQKSKRTTQSLADFKMYRLNIWQHSTNPWLLASDWQACRLDFKESDLEGRECAAGLDLSRTRDMSALVLVFPDEGGSFKVLPFFWLPQERADELNSLFPVKAWASAGFIELTPGNVIDYGFIKSRFRELAERFNIRKLAFDPKYAEETTQSLEQGETDKDGKQIAEGTGVERVIFKQSIMEFCAPTADFERLVKAGKLHHNGNPVLSWQAGHVQVYSDFNRNIRPTKPPRGNHKTIDGVVAAIMGLREAQILAPSDQFVFEAV